MKVLVTGARGMLGRDVCADFTDHGHDVVSTTRCGADGFLPLDITSTQACTDLMTREQPDVIVNCAAWTNVDGAEREPEAAYMGNALGAWNLAHAARSANALMVQVSTDFVFDGAKQAAYTEFDTVNPLGVYGASKEVGERLVRETLPGQHIITRTSWLYGVHGKNFVRTIQRLAQTMPQVPVVADQVGCPTWTKELSRKIVELVEAPLLAGTYHVCGAGECSWFEFAQEIAEQSKLARNTIVPITAQEYATRFNSPTRRPPYSPLRRLSLEMRGRDDMPHWKESLAAFLQQDSASCTN